MTAAILDTFPICPGLRHLAESYDGYICDLWGVLHDGVTAFPQAVDCLRQLRARGKQVVILSNAPRRVHGVTARMSELGITSELYDAVHSSGEDCWQHLRHRPDAFYRDLGQRCFHLGPARDFGMREGLNLTFVADPSVADFILATGIAGPQDSIDTYRHQLDAARTRDLPMVCANPDLEVVRGGARELCAGALAAAYEAMGGRVRYHGKPHPEIYQACFDAMSGIPASRILALGDSLRTDILGAQQAGIDSVLVLDGIHADTLRLSDDQGFDRQALEALCRDENARPLAAMAKLRW